MSMRGVTLVFACQALTACGQRVHTAKGRSFGSLVQVLAACGQRLHTTRCRSFGSLLPENHDEVARKNPTEKAESGRRLALASERPCTRKADSQSRVALASLLAGLNPTSTFSVLPPDSFSSTEFKSRLTRRYSGSISWLVPETQLLEGQNVIVTGAGRGIGRAIALLCAEEGARVAILARSQHELDSVVQESNARGVTPMLMRTVDVTDEDAVDAAISELAQEMGSIDLLVNNAGGAGAKGPVHEQNVAEFRKLLDLNVVSIMIVSSAVLRHAMLRQGRGHIINISSRAGKVGLPRMGSYVASKFAVEGLTATMAAELKAETGRDGSGAGGGIRVNSISPGMVDTVSFPKAAGRPGVRTAESIRDGLLYLHLESGGCTGRYLHVDEFDAAVEAGKPEAALKLIDEPVFAP